MPERSFSVVLSARVDQYVAAMDKAKRAGAGFSAETSRNMAKVGGQMQQVGGWMTTRVSLPLAALGTAAGKLGYDFEMAFARMQGLANVPAAEIDNLKDSVLSLARETAAAPQELADALYFAASAGLDSAAAMDAVGVAARASAAGMGSAEEVVGLVASAMASYGADALDAAKATDILTRTVQEGRADPAELAGTLGRILPIASQLGVEFEEVGGATAFLSNVFGDTGRTVTAMSGFFAKLVAPTKQGRQALLDMGTSAEELQQVLRDDGLVAALELLRTKGFAGNQQALRALFDDIEGYQGALALLNDNSGQLVGTMDAVADSTGALGEAFGAVADTEAFRIKQSANEVKTSLTEVGAALLPLAADIIGPVASGFTELVDAIMSLPAPLRNLTVGFIGAAIAAGPLLSIGGGLVRNFESIKGGVELARVGLQRLGMSAGAATGAMGALGLVAVAAGAAFIAYQSFGAEQRKVDERAREVAAGLGEATSAAIANANATDTARVAHQALSSALTSTGEDGKKLTSALGTLGLRTDDVLDVFGQFRTVESATGYLKGLIAASDEFGNLTEAQQGTLGAAIAQMDELSAIYGVADRQGMNLTDSQKRVVAAMEELQDQAEKSDLDQMVRDFLSTDAASSDVRQSLLAQAEAQTDLGRTGDDLLPLYEAYVALLAENKAGLVDTEGATEVYTAALAGTEAQADATMTSTERLTKMLGEQGDILDALADSADRLGTALDKILAPYGDLEAAQRSWEAGVDDLTESIKDNGATLDVSTEKGRANRAAIADQVDGIRDWMVALVQSGATTEDAAAAGDMLRESLIGQLDQLGFTREEAEAYVAQLGLTPESIRTAVELANAEAARLRVEGLLESMEEIPTDVETEIAALIETSQFDEAERRLLRLQEIAARGASMPVQTRGPVGTFVPQADGGYHDRATFAMIGEAGREVVLPLTRPNRLRALLSDPRVFPAVASAMGITAFANGGIVGRVVNAGSTGSVGGDQSRLMANRFETGDLSAGDYRAFLGERLAGLEKYSDEWMDIWRKIRTLDDQGAQASRDRLAEEDRIQQAMVETGAISAAAYETYLLRRLGDFQQYSADWMAVWRQLQDLQREEERASGDAVSAAFDRAESIKNLADAERDLAEATAAAGQAEAKAFLYAFDRNRSTEERAQAQDELARARERVADAAFAGAGARGATNGLAANTPEFARFVRSEVEGYAATQSPEIAAALQRLLLGVPNFANGGFVGASAGGTLVRAGEAGRREWILQDAQLQAIRDNAGYQAAMHVAARTASNSAAPLIGGDLVVGDRRDVPAAEESLRALAWRAKRRA